jgi:hypothetical protein
MPMFSYAYYPDYMLCVICYPGCVLPVLGLSGLFVTGCYRGWKGASEAVSVVINICAAASTATPICMYVIRSVCYRLLCYRGWKGASDSTSVVRNICAAASTAMLLESVLMVAVT